MLEIAATYYILLFPSLIKLKIKKKKIKLSFDKHFLCANHVLSLSTIL